MALCPLVSVWHFVHLCLYDTMSNCLYGTMSNCLRRLVPDKTAWPGVSIWRLGKVALMAYYCGVKHVCIQCIVMEFFEHTHNNNNDNNNNNNDFISIAIFHVKHAQLC